MIRSYLEVAEASVRQAGAKIREMMGSVKEVDELHAHDVKLALDRECQELLTSLLLGRFASHTVFGEEGGTAHGGSEYQWIVDPIDGTVNFYYGFPYVCTTVALQRAGKTIVGVIYDPLRDEMFSAAEGEAATLNGSPIRVSDRKQIAEAMIATGFAKSDTDQSKALNRINYLSSNARKIRMNGSAALDMANVACGRFDAYVESGIRLWDVAAGHLIIERAGGKVDLRQIEGMPGYYQITASSGQFPIDCWV